jgi:hypothetical protein
VFPSIVTWVTITQHPTTATWVYGVKVLARSASGANRSNMRRRDPAIKQTAGQTAAAAGTREIKTQNIDLPPLSDGPPNQKAIQQDGQYKKELHNRKLVTKVSTVHAKKPSVAYPSVIHAS